MARTDTPTFWRLSDLVRSLDAVSAMGSETAMWGEVNKVGADAQSVEYMASQRAVRMLPHMGIDPKLQQKLALQVLSAITVAWMEGFVCGRRFPEPED